MASGSRGERFVLRRMGVEDVDAVDRLSRASFEHPWTRNMLERELENDFSTTILAVKPASEIPETPRRRSGGEGEKGEALGVETEVETGALEVPDLERNSGVERAPSFEKAPNVGGNSGVEGNPGVDRNPDVDGNPGVDRNPDVDRNPNVEMDASAEELSDAEEIVGFIVYWTVLDDLHILNIAVHPRFRRRGIAQMLLARCENSALASGADHITLEVRRSNIPAITLYEQAGFRGVGVRVGYYEPDGEDALVMSKTVV